MAAWLAAGGSLALAMTATSTMAGLQSLQTQERLAKAIEDAGLGLEAAQLMPWLRVGLYVVGVVAAVGFVSAIFAARRDRLSRVLVTVCAVVVFITGIFLDPLLAAMVGVAATLLWSKPANEWFAGVASTPSPSPARAQVAATGTPSAYSLSRPQTGPNTQARPAVVTLGAMVAVVMSSVMFVRLATAGVDTARDADGVLRAKFDADPRLAAVSFEVIQGMLVAMVIVLALWALAAVILGALSLRGIAWARLALVISASIAGPLSLIATFASSGYLVVAIACMLTIWSLSSAPARQWYAAGKPAPQPLVGTDRQP